MDHLKQNKYLRSIVKLSTILVLLFAMIFISSNFYTQVYTNNKQLELCDIARENKAYSSPVCFFDQSYSYAKGDLEVIAAGGSPSTSIVCKDEYTIEEMESEEFIDSDNDGIPDDCDVCPLADNADDEDQDEMPDDCDVCPGGDDLVDTDGDGIPDDCDVCPGGDDMIDTDGDGVPNSCDVCPDYDDQLDVNQDGVADDCEGFSLFSTEPDNQTVTPKYESIYDTRNESLDSEVE